MASPGRQLALRRPDRCALCAAELPIGTVAFWATASRTVTCLDCADGIADPPGPALVDPGKPGASGLREFQRRRDAREQHARDKLGAVGGILAKLTDEPASTKVWKQGADGEVRVGSRLEKLLAGGPVRLLHDRQAPGRGHANIDHIAVGPGGVTVIDTKTHGGKIRSDWYGGLFVERRAILRIDGRDQTKLITGVEKQVGYVKAALAPLEESIDVRGALCFPDVDGLPVLRRIEIRGVLVDGPKRVAQLAARPGLLDAAAIERVWRALAHGFPTA